MRSEHHPPRPVTHLHRACQPVPHFRERDRPCAKASATAHPGRRRRRLAVGIFPGSVTQPSRLRVNAASRRSPNHQPPAAHPANSQAKTPASSPSPSPTCGGERRGEEASHTLKPPFISQPPLPIIPRRVLPCGLPFTFLGSPPNLNPTPNPNLPPTSLRLRLRSGLRLGLGPPTPRISLPSAANALE
jgi:hypothetical protein